MIVIRLVFGRMRSGSSLECFLVEFGQFFTILGLCEKNLCYAIWDSLGHPENDEKFLMFGMIFFFLVSSVSSH